MRVKSKLLRAYFKSRVWKYFFAIPRAESMSEMKVHGNKKNNNEKNNNTPSAALY
jgi:hypothetical protein